MRPRSLAPKFFVAAVMAAALWGAAAKDFPEPVAAVDPLLAAGSAAAASLGSPAGFTGAFEYGNYAFSHDEVDSFYLRGSAAPVFLDLGGRFALGGLYESVLMCGPVPAGDTPVNVAAFWMNAVQFEYGLYASAAPAGLSGIRLLAEYSRTSQHPIRSGYSEVATDILMVGLAPPALGSSERKPGAFTLVSDLRLGYRDLFDFWQSSLPKPRVSWVAKPAIEAEVALSFVTLIVARVYPEVFIDRYTGLLDANLFAELGLALNEGKDAEELLLTLYKTGDSDLLRGAAHPTFEAGLAFRFSHGRNSPSLDRAQKDR